MKNEIETHLLPSPSSFGQGKIFARTKGFLNSTTTSCCLALSIEWKTWKKIIFSHQILMAKFGHAWPNSPPLSCSPFFLKLLGWRMIKMTNNHLYNSYYTSMWPMAHKSCAWPHGF